MITYPESFYQRHYEISINSAREVIPLVLEYLKPTSVVDVGCGNGTWLSVFIEKGLTDVVGFDGPYVNPEQLLIPKEAFKTADLEQPIKIDRKFDLVVSLEVAEHLSSDRAANFVDSLTGLGSTILFSAAIPFQGGDNHINEQWQDYWCKLFRERGYVPVDFLRRRVWNNTRVADYYIQNTILYVAEDKLPAAGFLRDEFNRTDPSQLNLVHPRVFLRFAYDSISLKKLLSSFVKLVFVKLGLASGNK